MVGQMMVPFGFLWPFMGLPQVRQCGARLSEKVLNAPETLCKIDMLLRRCETLEGISQLMNAVISAARLKRKTTH